jgi:hypothetical protein
MDKEIRHNRFGLVSVVGNKHLLSGGHASSRKYIQTFFRPEELQWKTKEKLLTANLSNDEYLKLEVFLKNYPSQEYYFFTADEKIHFTFKKIDYENERYKVHFHVNKLEKLVYPEIEVV